MKILKVLLGLVALLAAVLFGGGLLLSGDFKVTREALIDAPPDKVYALLADPREWQRWAVWNQRDPAMKIEYSGAASGSGARWSWQSDSQGDGTMTFTLAEPGRQLAYELYFPDFKTTSKGSVLLSAQGSGTQVRWTMEGNMGQNPLFRWFALNADSMVGKDFEESLAGLQRAATATGKGS